MKISDLDKFERTPDYREIYSKFFGKDVSGDVIHHLIEKNSRYAKLFEKEVINAPRSLRAIPKGSINEVLHLSEIRKGWDKIYTILDDLFARGGSAKRATEIITDFARKSDTYIEKCLEAISLKQAAQAGKALSKQEISTITQSLLHLLN
jgi:hypothetical protein